MNKVLGRNIYAVVAIMGLHLSAFAQGVQMVNAFPALTFNHPLYLTNSGDGTDRIFVVQQDGTIAVFPNDSSVTSPSTFLNIADKLSSTDGEQGLLCLVFHPNYATNGYFYVTYTAPNPLRTVVARYSVMENNPNEADTLSEYTILEIPQPFEYHKAGMLIFGADGYLYISTGDGGGNGDPFRNGQNRSVLLGKILRIDANTTTDSTHYTIPPDNPFIGNSEGYREEIWAWGFRNPWRWSEDRITGQMWVADVQEAAGEEINLLQEAGNYGWNCYECNEPYDSTGCGPASEFIFPLKSYDDRDSNCSSVTGGYIYRGSREPELVGRYIYGDFCSGKIWKFLYENGTITEDTLLLATPFIISSFGLDEENELYVCNYGEGTIHRFGVPPVVVPTTIRAGVIALLEGPYNGETMLMNDALATSGVLAARFSGIAIPLQAVDSITIELRDAAANPTVQQYSPAWLLSDGTIRAFSDTTKSYVEFETIAGDYYLAVHHRNHISVMSSSAIGFFDTTLAIHDFTTSHDQAYGTNPMKQIESKFVMYAGDTDQSGNITLSDADAVIGDLGSFGYTLNDCNLSGIVTAADENAIFGNWNEACQIP